MPRCRASQERRLRDKERRRQFRRQKRALLQTVTRLVVLYEPEAKPNATEVSRANIEVEPQEDCLQIDGREFSEEE